MHPSSPPPYWPSLLSRHHFVWSIPLISLVQLSKLSSPKTFPTLRLLAGGVRGWNFGETALMLLEHSSAVAKTLLCYHFLSYQCKAQRCEHCYRRDSCTSARPNTQG